MRMSDIERRFEEIEKKIKKLESWDPKFVMNTQDTHQTEEKKKVSLSVDEPLETRSLAEEENNTEESLSKTDTHPPDEKDKSLDIPYPKGHNWEGLTPRQVNTAYDNTDKKKKGNPKKVKNE